MVFTLHRYILRELLRVFILAAAALTLMLSLGSILEPVQEYGVGPKQVIHLMGYFLPITLTFVLPIAALFSCSLVYGRFASDNELEACRASGISLSTLIYPGLAIAIAVATANLILSFYVMPAFAQRAEKSIKADAKQIIFRNIHRTGYYKPPKGDYLIYADLVDFENDTLRGIVITSLKDNQTLGRVIAAESAKVNFNTGRIFNEVQITAKNTFQLDSDGFWSLGLSSFTKDFPSLMEDNINFKKIDDMKKIRLNPMEFAPVAKLARNTFAQFATESLKLDIEEKLNEPNSFYELFSGRKRIKFHADKVTIDSKKEKQIQLTGNIKVNEYDINSKQVYRTLECEQAVIYIEGDETTPTITFEAFNPSWEKTNETKGIAAGKIRIYGLLIPQQLRDEIFSKSIIETVLAANLDEMLNNSKSDILTGMQNELRKKIRKTLVDIKTEINARLVFGIGCIPMIMIGIALGIMKKGGHLLSAFGASCVPAAVLIVFIMMGKNVAKNLGSSQVVSGIMLTWIGVGILFTLMVVLYHKLLKN